MSKVLIILGSMSDSEGVKSTIETLEDFGVDYSVRIASAHRTPNKLDEVLEEEDQCKVIIAVAGMAAHLPGVIASKRPLIPVIGLPISNEPLNGIDALLSMVQMPNGVPIATVTINGFVNAAVLAVQILALADPSLYGKLLFMKSQVEAKVDDFDDKMINLINTRKNLKR